jgi:hypothetical protein
VTGIRLCRVALGIFVAWFVTAAISNCGAQTPDSVTAVAMVRVSQRSLPRIFP